MSGGTQSQVKVVLRNPLNHSDQIDYTIDVYDHELGNDWIVALKELLQNKNQIEKNFCFMGFPKTARNLEYMCNELNDSIQIINTFNSTPGYQVLFIASPYRFTLVSIRFTLYSTQVF